MSSSEFKGKLLEFVKIEQIKASRVSHKENSISPLFNQVKSYPTRKRI